jgi:late competence protein required for DNA uptake (superfamily II DNA/RNA helicase)
MTNDFADVGVLDPLQKQRQKFSPMLVFFTNIEITKNVVGQENKQGN